MTGNRKIKAALWADAVNIPRRRVAGDGLYRAVTAMLLTLGVAGAAYSASSGLDANAAAAAVAGCALCAAAALLHGRKYGWLGALLIPLLMAAVCAAFFEPVRSGFCAIVNSFSQTVMRCTGRIVLDLDVAGGSRAGNTLAAALIAASAGLLAGLAVNSGRGWTALLPAAALAAGLASGCVPVSGYVFVLAAGVLMQLVRAVQVKNAGALRAGGLACSAALALVCAATLWGAFTASLGGYDSAALKDRAEDAVHDALYDSAALSMPEGRLTALGAWTPGSGEALAVTMDTPQKLYLRGFVGERYDGTRWRPLEGGELAAYSGTFYWLHRDGFFAQTQLASAMELTGDAVKSGIEIENTAACRRYAFLPYALADSGLPDAGLIGDKNVYAASSTVKTSYIAGSVPEWHLAQARLAALQEAADAETETYLAGEQTYSEFVYASYLQITQEASAALGERLGTETTSMTLSEIKTAILSFLSENITYDESAGTPAGGYDFLTYLLDRSCTGYSVHYATAATLLFRYYGVPARYVEGYYISADEAAGYDGGDRISVDERHAHAWTEYYLDGVGWMPFEVTPGYIDDERIAVENVLEDENSQYVEYTGKTYTNEHAELSPPSSEPIQNITLRQEAQLKAVAASLVKLLPLLPLLLLAAALIYVLLARRRLKRALSSMYGERDNSAAIAMMFGYSTALLEQAGMERPQSAEGGLRGAAERWYGDGRDLSAVLDLNGEALFSAHELTDAQRGEMKKYLDDTLSACRNRWSAGKRFYYKWIRCIY